MDVVVVESPAKAKTINKYLGSGFTVLASYGHIRDLPSKDGSVRPDEGFAMDWEVDAKAKKHIDAIAQAVKGAGRLFLATDPDREGEAISWHVREVLAQKKALGGVEVKRVVFNEITKTAIQHAFTQPRELDTPLVEAYLARRALDYLVGFTLSPVLWRKLPGSRSAGRVQSVALRLICEREAEIEAFKAQEYWTVAADFATKGGARLTAQLVGLNGEKLDKMALGSQAQAIAAVKAIEARVFSVAAIDRRKAKRHPAPPFTTSTLQQEAARKLRFSARRTMDVAQKLYEGVTIGGETVGLITYMRTDGVQMADEAIRAARDLIGRDFGAPYLPAAPRIYKTKAKNAQEAHEAIRPTDLMRRPDSLQNYLSEEQLKLYSLIWKRTVASQMESAILDQVSVDVASGDRGALLRATGSVVAFDGYFRLYQEGRDDDESGDEDKLLPDLKEGEALDRLGIRPEQHFTQPPPRFSEASLVKRLEELGIGRPSTYASIISVLQDRDYVRLDKQRFIPEDRGRLVTAFLTSFFGRYVEYDFTAHLEEELDDISGGRMDWKAVLTEFWAIFAKAVEDTRELRTRDVLDALDRLLGPHFFHEGEDGRDPRVCPTCGGGRLSLKLGKYGAFIGCSNYPDCRFTRRLVVEKGETGEAGADGAGETPVEDATRVLGTDPESGLEVTVRKGPYGPYVQLGEAKRAPKAKGKKKAEDTKPKRASLPKGMAPEAIDLERALALLALPRDLGKHPEDGQTISAGIGRFGPYIRHGRVYVSLKEPDDVLSIGMNRAVDLLAGAGRKKEAKELGKHPEDGAPVTLHDGRFGPYVQHGSLRATLPKGTAPESLSLDAALPILAAKAAKGPSTGRRFFRKGGKAKG
ncbi:MAG: type I DNA topoisomerase [Magnetospirillum sp. WYHS-4]